jgi:hypothetical protein
MNINKLLEFTDSIGFDVREIDKIIHRWPNHNNIEYNLQEYIDHQYMLIALSEGNEKKIFNDPKTHSGKTGTMTDILRACYFILYNSLLQKDLEINIENDFNIFITLLLGIKYNRYKDKLIMPLEEFEAIQNILYSFRINYPELFFEKKKFLENLKRKTLQVYDELDSWTWWKENPNKRSPHKIYHRLPYNNKRTLFNGIWEAHPCYINYCSEFFNLNIVQVFKNFDYLIEFFEDPFSKECIDILTCDNGKNNDVINENLSGEFGRIFQKKLIEQKINSINQKINNSSESVVSKENKKKYFKKYN